MTDDEFDAAVAEAVAMQDAEHKLSALVRLRKSVLRERLWHRILTGLSILGTCAAIWLGASTFFALRAYEQSRDDARITACESYNADTVDKVNGILLSLAAGSEDPEATKQLLSQLLLHHRICTPDGIRAYYDQDDTTDPFEEEVP